MQPLRAIAAVAASIVLVPVTIWAGLISALSIIQQVLSTFFDLSQASWTSFLNPAVLLGIRSPGGTGGIMDAMVGGPGAPGGTVSRYITFIVFGMIAYISFMITAALWRWARKPA